SPPASEAHGRGSADGPRPRDDGRLARVEVPEDSGSDGGGGADAERDVAPPLVGLPGRLEVLPPLAEDAAGRWARRTLLARRFDRVALERRGVVPREQGERDAGAEEDGGAARGRPLRVERRRARDARLGDDARRRGRQRAGRELGGLEVGADRRRRV